MKRYLLVIGIAALAYLAWPFLAIAQLGNAVQGGDVETLEKRVDWDGVRGYLKADLSQTVSANLQDRASNSGNALGGLLASVIAPSVSEGVVDGLVDATVTPEVIAELSKRRSDSKDADTIEARREEMLKDPLKHVQWAFFSGPTTFEAQLRPDRGEPVTQFNFELQGLNWKLVRVIPPENFSLQAG